MTRRRFVILAVVALVVASGVAVIDGTAATTDAGEASTANATLVEAYPNPVARGDPGEFVTVRFEAPTNTTGWSLTDGKTVAHLPNRTVEGTVAFSVTPAHARNHTDHRVSELEGRLLLADGGEELRIENENRVVDTARYRNAPESEIRDFEASKWQPVGATDFEPTDTDGGEARAFVLPDAPEKTASRLATADERVYLAGYTLSSEAVVESLVDAHRRSAEVRVLLDGAPVGGMTDRQARHLERLTDAGIEVRLLAGEHTRYRHHHPKYAVVDDRAVVLTENFKPAGTGGMSSRGWGITLDDPDAVETLADVHAADWEWRAATPWEHYCEGREFTGANPALGSFETRHPPEQVPVDSTTVLVAPDSAADALESKLGAADERILIQQVEVGSRDDRLLRAALRAADRGVAVRVHLSDGWYVEEDNADLVAWLNRRAEAEGWNLEARVDDSVGYERIHTKGVVIDDTAVIGSLNWKRSAKEDNREVAVAVEGEQVAAYYADVFETDWSAGGGGDSRSLPAGLLGIVAVAVAAAMLAVRRIEFVGRDGVITDWKQ